MNITVRDINPAFWRELKLEAVKKGMTVGQAVNLALDALLHANHENKKKSKVSFWDIKPAAPKTKDAEKLSTMIDDVLYG
jgi:20S proteasome alpha/beta subunit